MAWDNKQRVMVEKQGIMRVATSSFFGESWERVNLRVDESFIRWSSIEEDAETNRLPLSHVLAVQLEDIGDATALCLTFHKGDEEMLLRLRGLEDDDERELQDWKILILLNMEQLSPRKVREAARRSSAAWQIQTAWRKHMAMVEAGRRRSVKREQKRMANLLASMCQIAAKCEAKLRAQEAAALTIQRVERGHLARSQLQQARARERCMVNISAKMSWAQVEQLLPLKFSHTATVKASVTRLWRDWGRSLMVEIQGECSTYDAEHIALTLDNTGVKSFECCLFDRLRAAVHRSHGNGAWY